MSLLINGKSSVDGAEVPIKVDANGVVQIAAGSGGGGTTSADKAEDAASANGDLGIPAMAVRKATPANTSNTDGDYEFLQMSQGRLWTTSAIDTTTGAFSAVSSATLSNVAASASNVTLLAANSSRKRIVIHNDSTSKLRIKFGATASSTSFTVALNGYETYESPNFNVYVGIIDGIWDSATGSARITELT
jgi:hypothetical protein